MLPVISTPSPVVVSIASASPSRMTDVGRLKPSCVGLNVGGILIFAAELGFGLYMGVASLEAVKFLFGFIKASAWTPTVETFFTVFLRMTGLLAGMGPGLAVFNLPKVLKEVKDKWSGLVSDKDLSKPVMYLNIGFNILLWSALSIGSVLALKALGLDMSNPGIIILSIYLGLANFFNCVLNFVSDIIQAPFNFRSFFNDPARNKIVCSAIRFSVPEGYRCWALRSLSNALLKASRQSYMGMSGLALFSRSNSLNSWPIMLAGTGVFLIAAYETFFTQSWKAYEEIKAEKAKAAAVRPINRPSELNDLAETKEAPTVALAPQFQPPVTLIHQGLPENPLRHCLKLTAKGVKEFFFLCINVGMGLSLVLSNMTFCGGFFSNHIAKFAVMLLAGLATGTLAAPQTIDYFKPKIREGAQYGYDLLSCKCCWGNLGLSSSPSRFGFKALAASQNSLNTGIPAASPTTYGNDSSPNPASPASQGFQLGPVFSPTAFFRPIPQSSNSLGNFDIGSPTEGVNA